MIKKPLMMIVMAAFLAGCVPYSDNPLTDPSQQTMDVSIYGTWFWKEDNGSGYIHIGLDRNTKLLNIVMVEYDKNVVLKLSELVGHTSVFAENKYLNLKWVIPTDEEPGYLIVKYEVTDGKFGIALIDNGAVEQAVKSGSLPGEVKGEGWLASVHITAESKQLQEFVAQHDKDLFKEKAFLRRLDLP